MNHPIDQLLNLLNDHDLSAKILRSVEALAPHFALQSLVYDTIRESVIQIRKLEEFGDSKLNWNQAYLQMFLFHFNSKGMMLQITMASLLYQQTCPSPPSVTYNVSKSMEKLQDLFEKPELVTCSQFRKALCVFLSELADIIYNVATTFQITQPCQGLVQWPVMHHMPSMVAQPSTQQGPWMGSPHHQQRWSQQPTYGNPSGFSEELAQLTKCVAYLESLLKAEKDAKA